ncbi:MAG: pseudouridine-5'-phosphate glycosidase, partial [Actinomycetes bacterium]
MSLTPNNFVFSQDVARAMSQGLPIVALESTIISHGLPS